jgi:hypothetical protein
MMTGSYRMDDVIEIWDLRMNKRTRTIPWEGTGAQEDMIYEEIESERGGNDSVLGSITNSFAAAKKPVQKKHKLENEIAPFLYTACFN